MLILAYLLCHNLEWAKHHVRVLRALQPKEDPESAKKELKSIVYESRIRGEAKVVTVDEDFQQTLSQHSHDATVVFIGLGFHQEEFDPIQMYNHLLELTKNLPTTLLIHNSGEADLLI